MNNFIRVGYKKSDQQNHIIVYDKKLFKNCIQKSV